MKSIIRTIGIILVCGLLIVPSVDAQTRGRNTPSTSRDNRPSRPATPTRPSAPTRPTRPTRPTKPSTPNTPNRPGVATPPPPPPPAAHPGRPSASRLPQRLYRPTPPPAWRPPSSWRVFNSIMGIALGTSIDASIYSLMNSGYVLTRYGDNTLYVQNVRMLNLLWPDAMMFYNNYGQFYGSQFTYTTSYQDMSRYNTVYSTLFSTYGSPYSTVNNASGIEVSWWGTNNQFITLSYKPQYTSTGSLVYYTTLTYGQ